MQELKIEGTSCERCVMSIQAALSSLEGVQARMVQPCVVTLEFDPRRHAVDELMNAIPHEGFAVGDGMSAERSSP